MSHPNEFARAATVLGGVTNKVHVIEFFSYGCPWCSRLESALEKLLATNRQASSDRRALMFSEYTNQASREEASKKRKVERASDENRFTVSPLEMKAREKRLLSDGRSSFGGEKAEQYQDRQNQALERRQKHEAVLSKRPPFTAKPLPVPP